MWHPQWALSELSLRMPRRSLDDTFGSFRDVSLTWLGLKHHTGDILHIQCMYTTVNKLFVLRS